MKVKGADGTRVEALVDSLKNALKNSELHDEQRDTMVELSVPSIR